MQSFTGISRNTESTSHMLSLTERDWEFQNNALWDTHKHTLLRHLAMQILYTQPSAVSQPSRLLYQPYIASIGFASPAIRLIFEPQPNAVGSRQEVTRLIGE